MKKTEESPLFVGIHNPIEVRRNLLEASKELIRSLQKYENFKSTRHQKISSLHKLKKDIKEISALISKLKLALPKVTFPKLKPVKKEKPKLGVPIKEKPGEEYINKDREELTKLESELAEIEKKLEDL